MLSCCLASFPPAQLFGCSVRHFLAQLLLSIHAAACRDSVTGVEGCWELMLPRGHSLQITKPGFPPMQSLLQRRSLQHRLPIWRFCVVPRTCFAVTDQGPTPTRHRWSPAPLSIAACRVLIKCTDLHSNHWCTFTLSLLCGSHVLLIYTTYLSDHLWVFYAGLSRVLLIFRSLFFVPDTSGD